ncbi:glutamate--cysteine ligase regulatory subunit-like [Ciona intestinalis]
MSMDTDRNEVARIMVGHASHVRLHTGNVINWNLLKKHKFRPAMTSSDELMDAMHTAMQTWIRSMNIESPNLPEPRNLLDVSNTELVAPIDSEQRDQMKLSVKLFLTRWNPELIRQAVDHVTRELGVQRIDSVIVSLPISPPTSIMEPNNNSTSVIHDLEKVKPIWKEMQSTVDSGHVTNIGVCDFDQESLKELNDWARIKPSTNQINLTNCCAVPCDLIQYSREKSIELLTHNDPAEILSGRKFQSFMSEATDDINSTSWSPAYVARYSVLVRYRGIVHSKGYLLSAERSSQDGAEDYGFF